MISTLISVLLAVGISFYSPEVPESENNSIDLIELDKFNKVGFPVVYYQGELLSEETARYRRRVAFVSLIFLGAGFFSWSSPSDAISASELQAEIFSKLSSQPCMEQLAPTFLPRIEGGKPTSGSPGHFAHGYGQHGLPPARRNGNAFGRRVPANNPPAGSGLFGSRSPGKTPGKLPSGLSKGSVGPVKTPPGAPAIAGAGAPNPAGGGSGGNNDRSGNGANRSAPKKKKSQDSKTFDYDYRSNDPKNKNKSKDQCEATEQLQVEESYKSNSALKKITEKAQQNVDVINNVESVKK